MWAPALPSGGACFRGRACRNSVAVAWPLEPRWSKWHLQH
jgi:hypothetical protein